MSGIVILGVVFRHQLVRVGEPAAQPREILLADALLADGVTDQEFELFLHEIRLRARPAALPAPCCQCIRSR